MKCVEEVSAVNMLSLVMGVPIIKTPTRTADHHEVVTTTQLRMKLPVVSAPNVSMSVASAGLVVSDFHSLQIAQSRFLRLEIYLANSLNQYKSAKSLKCKECTVPVKDNQCKETQPERNVRRKTRVIRSTKYQDTSMSVILPIHL